MSELAVMITSEVPTARRMERARTMVRVGTIRKPPPTPKKPVIAPIRRPAARSRVSRSGGQLDPSISLADDEGCGGRLVDALSEDVDEDRHREHGAAAAEHAETQTDPEAERYGGQDHAG